VSRGIVYLMYHELELPGRAMCLDDPGYVRYIVTASDFRAHMDLLMRSGFRGLSVSEALADPQNGVAITFDDGCETDLLTAAPMLRDLGFNATSYVTVGFLGKAGYLSRAQVRELSELGIEVGSHSLTHPYLTDLSDDHLARELADSKKELEEITGRLVHHFSCPGGRYDRRVIAHARKAGYQSVANSKALANTKDSDRYELGRVAVMRGMDAATVNSLSKGHGLWSLRAKDAARGLARGVLGNAFYDRFRSRILTKPSKNQ
jgi:peptidoglycan/xylan/chitin deacetylase (PgdA/CDA1 family)